MLERYIAYFRNNPEGYWFKRKIFGWGWVPVTWQGWLVTAVAVALIAAGVAIGQTDDVPGAAVLGIVLAVALIFGFGYRKGERPRWQWGLRDEGGESR